MIIFARILNSRICPRKIRENENFANITRSTVLQIIADDMIVYSTCIYIGDKISDD